MILAGHPYIRGDFFEVAKERGKLPERLPTGIGYWSCGDTEFPDPHNFVDPTWNESDREMVVRYLKTTPIDKNWRWLGYPNCFMFCGISSEKLGTGERSDGVYIWPVGFAHYLEVHAVRPDDEFVEHVRNAVRAS